MAVGFGSSSSTNGSYETLGYKLLSLSRVRSIESRAIRFCHVMCEEEASRDLVRSIVNGRLRFSYGSSNIGHYNSSDERPGLIGLIKQYVVHSNTTTYPRHLSEK